LTCDRCGAGHGPWDSYAKGRIVLCAECRKRVPDEIRFAAPIPTDNHRPARTTTEETT
jgi:hypothetical protein